MNAVVIERQILLREAEDLGVHPPILWGRFVGPELVYAIGTMPNGRARSWSREPGEAAETFALRIRRDLQEQHCTGGARAAVLTG
ncbi:hypothetical protein IYW40_04670 [Methylocystis sp. H4A]|uniref:hypothetical protein n=1 Tax=Methylocystis sp. H4A TaxID=2785788 RepID=UPI0018C204C7|nr:hypothetical protein [Methylocystis sp. H4A]MBG0800787.1 hypothetical protein [Methylocystis sp. H4A]